MDVLRSYKGGGDFVGRPVDSRELLRERSRIRMHLVVEPSQEAMLTMLPHFVKNTVLSKREIWRM